MQSTRDNGCDDCDDDDGPEMQMVNEGDFLGLGDGEGEAHEVISTGGCTQR